MLDYWFDIQADFRAFFRIDEPLALSAVEFFAFAGRCVAYEGAVRWAWDLEAAVDQEVTAEMYDDGMDTVERLEDGGGEVVQTPVESSYLFDHFDVIVGDVDPERVAMDKEVVTHG